jgi:para-nitrobenzyl esterase
VPTRAYDTTDRRIAEAASSYLLNFARTGNPNGGGLVAWPAFTGASSPALFIGDNIAAAAVPSRPALDFFDAFYTQALGRALPF